jgi:aldehyde dehydrogenase (NAD+)
MKYLKYLFLLPVAVNLAGQLMGSPVMTGVSKPLLMPLIALAVFLVAKDKDIRTRRVTTIIVALLFGALGDVFLMLPGTVCFLLGMLAFLAGHVFYFSTLPAPWKVKGITGRTLSTLLFVALLAAVLVLASRFPLDGPMRIAVSVYACAFAFLIHACVVAAIDRKKPIFFLTALGFAIFAFSDVLVATGVFTDIRIPRRGFIVMSTYIAAQLIVSLSLLAEEIHELNDTEYGVRVKRLYALEDALKSHESEFVEAFRKDFGKGEFETYTTETGFLYSDIHHILNHLRDWMEPRAVPTPFVLWPARSRVFPEPYGKVLVIGPFNYPLHLVIAPLAAALAAGNTAVVKPSRQTPNVSSAVTGMLRGAFSPDVVEVLNDSVPNEEMLSGKYDYIFFTGSPRVGKIVMEAASRHLTPVTLELGGKSPAIVCADANVRLACERIAKGKFLNAGQTCVAPDYVLVHESVHDEFISTMKDVISRFFGDITHRPEEMTLMATRRHFDRVASLIPSERMASSDGTLGSSDGGHVSEVVIGGYTDPSVNYISPTVLDNCGWDDPSMQEEIFGPVLPVIVFRDLQTEVIDKVKAGEKPLSLYVFSRKRSVVRSILSQVSFGGGCINETVMHLGNENLPFGGVGNSGMGSYHGKTGFETFSHLKSVLIKSSCLNIDLLKPPYGRKIRIIKRFYK